MPLKLFKDFVLVHNLFYACLLHVEYMRFRMNNFSYNVLLKAIHIFMETTNKNRNLFFFISSKLQKYFRKYFLHNISK